MKKIALLGLLLSLKGLAADGDIPLRDWLKGFRQELPKVVCRSDGYYATCFEGGETACRVEMGKALESCINKMHLPNPINPDSSGRIWAEKIGNCTGKEGESKMAKTKSGPEKCNDIKRWFL